MRRAGEYRRAASVALWASLGMAVVFEALTVSEIEDKMAWAISPWRQDPYHTAVYLAQFAVPVLMLLIVLRLLAQRAAGGTDRLRQTVRSAAAMTALIAVTLAFEWAAVIAGANPAKNAWMAVQIGGLVVVSLLATGVAVLLVRCRQARGSSGQWQEDWLDDVIFFCHRIPVLRRFVSQELAAWARRHALSVFVTLSALGGIALTSAQVVGEHITDPLLITWYLIVETGSNLAFCLMSNALVVYIARPTRTRRRFIIETAVVAGCVATLATTAFHGPLASVFTNNPLSTTTLFILTVGAGLVTFLVTASVMIAATAGQKPTEAVEACQATSGSQSISR